MIKIYIAGKYTARLRLQRYKRQLIKLGYNIVSSWLDQHEGDYETITNEALRTLAIRDAREVGEAEVLIIDTLDETNTGGREVELGMAIAQNKCIFLVGPVRNLFHAGLIGFTTWDDLIKTIPWEV